MKSNDKIAIEKYKYVPSQDYKIIAEENKVLLFEMFEKIKKRTNSNNELACINAIITLFSKIEELDFLNKRAVFVYMRDISGLTPKQLSVAMSNIRKHYKDLKNIDDNYASFFFYEDF